MGKPAARVGDLTSHGGTIVSGSSNVFFNGVPAANASSTHICPMVIPGSPPVPHVGMLAVPKGATAVLINGVPAIVMGDLFLCVGTPASVVIGSPNILIGMDGCSGKGGDKADQAAFVSALKEGKIAPVKGTEAYPVDIQAAALVMQEHHSPEQFEEDLKLLDSMAEQRAQEEKESQRVKLTLKDFAEIFEAVEREQGYEAARYYSSVGINYDCLTAIAKSFTDGRDTNPDNDPNIMPTRFMLFYGADDSKLQCVDSHPDSFEGAAEHKITVTNLRKGLRFLGAKIAETGPYDDDLWIAHVQYLSRFVGYKNCESLSHVVDEGESLGGIAHKYGYPTWKHLYQINKEKIGDNPDLLKKGTELQLPEMHCTLGDELIAQKGAEPKNYAHGTSYRYPWVPFSVTFVNEKDNILKSNDEKKLHYELRDRESRTTLASGEISSGDELETLIPDSQSLAISMNGWASDNVNTDNINVGTISANDAVRVIPKKIIHVSGIMDGHAHHNSGACCPLPLIYTQVADTIAINPRRIPILQKREVLERLVSLAFKEGVNIQRQTTVKMGTTLAKMNKLTFADIDSSMDFAVDFVVKKAGAQIATPIIIATMDMERAHIAGYEGQTIYHEENDRLYYYVRHHGASPEKEGSIVDLSHEITENEEDKSKVLKLKKWAIQIKETRMAARDNPLHLMPLYFYDPRRFNHPTGTNMPDTMEYGAWDKVFDYIATESKPGIFAGIKMYPPLGHKPFDEFCEYLPEFYHQCSKDGIPILTHCSPSGMVTHEAEFYGEFDSTNEKLREKHRSKQYEKLQKIATETHTKVPIIKPGSDVYVGFDNTDSKERGEHDYFFKNYVHPEAWRPVLEYFPDLHLCLAHFGGNEWRRGPLSAWTDSPQSEWIKSIIDLTKTYDNVYTDISCFNLDNELFDDNEEGKKVRHTFNRVLYWIRDRDEYRHLRKKIIFGTDWYLTHLTRKDDSAKYGNYCREFKKLIDQVDPTLWIRITLINPWTCYSISQNKLKKMCSALLVGDAKESGLYSNLDKLLKLDSEISQIKEQLP